MPTVDPAVQLPVAMTLDEARAEVLSWLDPTRQPRIEWSAYVARSDLNEFADEPGCLVDYGDLWRVGDYGGCEPLPDVGIIVLASTWGMSMGIEGSHGGSGSPLDYDSCNSSELAREQVVGLFDAQTGRRLVATMDHWVHPDRVERWRTSALRTRHEGPLVLPSTAVPTPPMPRPTTPAWPTPTGPNVDRNSVPPAFRSTLTSYPLLPGSRWTWHVVERIEGVQWRTSLLTETVEAAWLIAPDRLAVRSLRRRQVLHVGMVLESEPAVAMSEDVWRLLRPDGFVLAVSDRPSDDIDGDGLYEPDRSRPGIVMEGWPFPHDRITMGSAKWQGSTKSVVTPAGRFDACTFLSAIGGVSWGSTRAFCPGVGYVRTDSGACSMAGARLGTMELVGYSVVMPR